MRVGSKDGRMAANPFLGAMEVEANCESLGGYRYPGVSLWCLWPQGQQQVWLTLHLVTRGSHPAQGHILGIWDQIAP